MKMTLISSDTTPNHTRIAHVSQRPHAHAEATSNRAGRAVR